MASTTQGALAGNVKFACSYCGVPRFYPDEMSRTAEGFFRCNWHENETTTNLEQAQIHAKWRARDQIIPRFPLGTKADWQT